MQQWEVCRRVGRVGGRLLSLQGGLRVKLEFKRSTRGQEWSAASVEVDGRNELRGNRFQGYVRPRREL